MSDTVVTRRSPPDAEPARGPGDSRNDSSDDDAWEDDDWDEDWDDIDRVADAAPPPTAPHRFGLRWFFSRRPEPGRPGTMPAGVVLVIITATLVLLMFLNAPATLRKSNAKDKGAWRQSIAQLVASVSDSVKLSAPRNKIDELRTGDDVQQVESPEELLAKKRAVEQAVAGPTTTGAVSKKPVLRTPTPEAPLSLWLGGDSITGAFGPEARKVLESSGLFHVTVESKPSSGLTRPDYLNWPKRLETIATTDKPDVMVIMFGANDAQSMPINGPIGFALYDENWVAEYRKRVATTMDLLESSARDRLVVWVGALPMGPSSGVRGMEKLNYIYWSEAKKRPWVAYVDPAPFFTDASGNYALSLPAADGKVQKLRANDNIHLNLEGADRLAWVLYGRLAKELDLSKSTIVAPPVGQMAPATVQERSELPRPPDLAGA